MAKKVKLAPIVTAHGTKSKVMDFVEKYGPMSRTGIIRYAFELKHDARDWDPQKYRGYCGPLMSTNSKLNSFVRPSRGDARYLVKNKDGYYKVKY